MTTATLAPPLARRDARPGLGRLTAVELRKMTDTRAGFWLLVGTVALVVAVVVDPRGHAATPQDHTLRDFLAIAVQPVGVLLPIVGILLVSSEWSQRTSLLTFTLVPHRSRVLAAKLAAGVVLSLAALQICIAVSLLGTAIADPGVADTWSLPAWMLGQTALVRRDRDDHRHRLRRHAAGIRAGDRALLRAPDRVDGARLARASSRAPRAGSTGRARWPR